MSALLMLMTVLMYLGKSWFDKKQSYGLGLRKTVFFFPILKLQSTSLSLDLGSTMAVISLKL